MHFRLTIGTIFLLTAMELTPVWAADMSSLEGTFEVQFRPMQTEGIREGCSLTFNTVGRDYATRQGSLVSLIGNITFSRNKARTAIILSLKLGVVSILDEHPKPEAPYFAYIQTPMATTATHTYAQFDSPDTDGAKMFVYQLDDEVMKVMEDMANQQPLIIGFNRRKGGMDILVPLDLMVFESVATPQGIQRRRSPAMLHNYLSCTSEVTAQVQKQLSSH